VSQLEVQVDKMLGGRIEPVEAGRIVAEGQRVLAVVDHQDRHLSRPIGLCVSGDEFE
jgi:hypothetical protein